MRDYSRSPRVNWLAQLTARLILLLVLVSASLQAEPARANSIITVDTTDGGLVDGGGAGDCSLAEAITNANDDAATYPDCAAGSGNDTIDFDPNLIFVTINLGASLPNITDADGLTIDGNLNITVNGNLNKIVTVSAPLTLVEMKINDGANGVGNGGAVEVLASGNLTVNESTFYSNEAVDGGAIYNAGTLSVSTSAFTSNIASSQGGAIYNAGTATITQTLFFNNEADAFGSGQGAGIFSAGTTTLYNNTFTGNRNPGSAGAALHVLSGTTTMYNNILANSMYGGDDCNNAGGTVLGNNNLVEDSTPACGFTHGVNGNIVGMDPKLDSGGIGVPGVVILLAGSPAIDAGDNAHVNGATLDALDQPRFVDIPWQNDFDASTAPNVDMGSYELPLTCPAGTELYVDADALGGNTGDSWTDAFPDLQYALNTIRVCGGPTEVWVAGGVYKPDAASPGDHLLSFNIPPGAALYGGFAGTESMRSQRDWVANPTVLSGDMTGDDDSNDADGNHIDELYAEIVGDNSAHVVAMGGSGIGAITSSTVLDGFTITGGQADAGGAYNEGGGIRCNATIAECSPTFVHLTLSGNVASAAGGMMAYGYGHPSSPILTDVTFVGNHATNNAGGLFAYAGVSVAGSSAARLTNVTFSNNSAGNLGGGMLTSATDAAVNTAALANVTFNGNAAATGGGYAHFAYGSTGGTITASLTNATFSSNSATDGGGIGNGQFGNGTSSLDLTNVILWGNMATGSGDQVYNSGAATSIDHSVVQDSFPGAIWDATLGTDGGNNLDGDPLLAALADNGGYTATMALQPGSSAMDTGDDTACAADPVNGVDQRGVTRPQGAHCDIGSFEVASAPWVRTDFEGDGTSDVGYFDATAGVWGVLQSSAAFSYGSPLFFSWGQTGDIIVPGDYDGDGLADPTIRRPPASGQSAAYMSLLSTTGYDFGSPLTIPAGWPGLGDTPVAADYNGDGITDPAIYRGNTSVWIIPLSPSFSSYMYASWGAVGDVPVGADVDGDNTADIGYYHAATGTWGFLLSGQNYSYGSPQFFSWGSSLDAPFMRDYDGDGLADPAFVTPPASGQSAAYRVLLSTTGYDYGQSATIPAGWPGLQDAPVPADYDGDGKADAAIWRGNTGVWIIPKSSTNNSVYMYAAWGANGDQVIK